MYKRQTVKRHMIKLHYSLCTLCITLWMLHFFYFIFLLQSLGQSPYRKQTSGETNQHSLLARAAGSTTKTAATMNSSDAFPCSAMTAARPPELQWSRLSVRECLCPPAAAPLHVFRPYQTGSPLFVFSFLLFVSASPLRHWLSSFSVWFPLIRFKCLLILISYKVFLKRVKFLSPL